MARNLYQRGGIWYWRKRIDGHEHRASTGFRDRKAAERRAVELELAARKGVLGWTRPRVVTFGEWAKDYARSYGQRKGDARRDVCIVAHVADWQHRPLESIAPSDCVGYIARREREGAAEGTITREVGLLRAMFNAAIRDNLTVSNPWTGIKRPRYQPRSRVLTVAEQAALVAKLNAEYQRLLVVALGTGLRAKELLSLRLRDVSSEEGIVCVRASTAKGGKARVVPLLPAVSAAINEQATVRGRQPDDRLWSQTRCSVYKYLKDAANKAGIPTLCIHDLRRTFGTRFAQALPTAMLQRIMGHSSPVITTRHYVHLEHEDLRRAMLHAALSVNPGVGTRAGTTPDATALGSTVH